MKDFGGMQIIQYKSDVFIVMLCGNRRILHEIMIIMIHFIVPFSTLICPNSPMFKQNTEIKSFLGNNLPHVHLRRVSPEKDAMWVYTELSHFCRYIRKSLEEYKQSDCHGL